MSGVFSKILAFLMSIIYSLASYGLFGKSPVTIRVTDENGEALSGVYVYYEDYTNEAYGFLEIGVTDENGEVVWENPGYGAQEIGVSANDITKTEQIFPDHIMKVTIPLHPDGAIEIKLTASATEAA